MHRGGKLTSDRRHPQSLPVHCPGVLDKRVSLKRFKCEASKMYARRSRRGRRSCSAGQPLARLERETKLYVLTSEVFESIMGLVGSGTPAILDIHKMYLCYHSEAETLSSRFYVRARNNRRLEDGPGDDALTWLLATALGISSPEGRSESMWGANGQAVSLGGEGSSPSIMGIGVQGSRRGSWLAGCAISFVNWSV